MARPLTRAQTLENAAFLKVLARTGNIREAVRETGLKHGTMFYRRAHHPAFALRWDAAVAVADARLAKRGGRMGPSGEVRPAPSAKPMPSDGLAPRPAGGAGVVSQTATLSACDTLHRTRGGEPTVVRRRDGKLQVRRAQPGKVTVECEQAFLAALAATANVTLAAAAVGVAEGAFYRRKRKHPGFAREMALAIEQGYERLELALLESTLVESHADDAWRHNDPLPIPPMTAEQALQLMYLHHKTAKLWDAKPQARKLPHETTDEMARRTRKIWQAKQARIARDDAVARAAEPIDAARSRFEPEVPVLPDLGQVRPKPHARSNAARETASARPAGRAANPADDTGFARVPPEPGAPEQRTGMADGRVSVKRAGRALNGGWRIA